MGDFILCQNKTASIDFCAYLEQNVSGIRLFKIYEKEEEKYAVY